MVTGDEGALSICDQKTVENREPALAARLLSGDILIICPAHEVSIWNFT